MKEHVIVITLLLTGVLGFQPCSHRFPHQATLSPVKSRLDPILFRHPQQKIRHAKVVTKLDSVSLEENEELAEDRKILTMVGYRISSLVYMSFGLFVIGWQGLQSPAQLPLALYVAAGPVLAGGISYVLEGAAVNDRLSSETFKRLNLFLASYGAIWLTAAFLIRKTGPEIVTHPLIVAASIISVFNSLRAWTFGVKGWKKAEGVSLASDLGSTTANMLRVSFSIKNFSGFVYLCGAFLFGFLKLKRLIYVFKLLGRDGVKASMISKTILQIGMYTLLSAVMVTLKDGADRDRLTGSSYVELNAISTFVLGSIGGKILHFAPVPLRYVCDLTWKLPRSRQAYFYNLGSIPFGAASAFFSFFTATMGYLTFQERRDALP